MSDKPDRFLCGYLVKDKDGILKQVDLKDNGGARVCQITRDNMNFNEIHNRLRKIFLEDNINCSSKLYDYRWRELDTNQYKNFKDYIRKAALTLRGTVLYLCVEEGNEINSNSSETQKRIPQIEIDSSPSIITIKSEDEEPTSYNRPVVNNYPEISSYSNYSFDQSLKELTDFLQSLMCQYNHEVIFIKLLKQICILQDHSSSILDPIKQQIHSIDQQQKFIYNEGLKKIKELSRAIETSIKSNKTKISNVDQHSIIINSFNKFYRNFNILCDRWAKETSNTFSSKHRCRKRPYVSSRSFSSSRKSTEKSSNNVYSLFKNLIKCLNNLFEILRQRHFTSYCDLVKDLISQMESSRLNIKVSDYESLSRAEESIMSLKIRLINQMDKEDYYSAPHKVSGSVEQAYRETIHSIRALLNSINSYQSNIKQFKRSQPTIIQENPVIQILPQSKSTIADDESSEASNSTVDEDDLRQIAHSAIKQTIH